MEKGWTGLPYHSISEHYRRIFNDKVYKIPVSIVDDCPNRMGLKGMKTCSFCDVWGSAAREESFELSLDEQIIKFHTIHATESEERNFFSQKPHTFLARARGESITGEHFVDPRQHAWTGESVKTAAMNEVLADGQLVVEARILEDHAEMGADRRGIGD